MKKFKHINKLVLLAIVSLLSVSLAACGNSDDSSDKSDNSSKEVSQVDLQKLAESSLNSSKTPVYWAGPKEGYKFELTQTKGGNWYIRYLPEGVNAGDKQPNYLTVATYPTQGYENIIKEQKRNNAKSKKLKDGSTVLVSPAFPKSVYVSRPGSDLQIEVYDPIPGKALERVWAGEIQPIVCIPESAGKYPGQGC